jgi:hypothetical protein
MEEAFGLDANPFPGEGISGGELSERYSDDVFPEETQEFRLKMIRGGLQGGRKTGFLWSISPTGEDTGFGKTTIMRNTVLAINKDNGKTVQGALGIKPERIKPIVAAMAEINEQMRNGLYPIVFAAAQSLAAGPSAVIPAVRQQLLATADHDKDRMWDIIVDTQMQIAPSGHALRSDLLAAFVHDDDGVADLLQNKVSEASRLRNGMQYFTGVVYILAAAGIEKVFLMIDQLEDLGKKGALSSGKRRREIGRIRDMLEMEPFASHLHMSFTFHAEAARNLEQDWHQNRLPSFDTSPANSAALVVLRGLRDNDQVEELLKVWMEPVRNEHAGPSPISPFTDDVLPVLLSVSQGRAGMLLYRANELLFAGAQAQVGEIDGAFAQQHFSGNGQLSGVFAGDGGVAEADYDDLLA